MNKALLSIFLIWSTASMATEIEEPRWGLLATLDGIEVRQYEPSVEAVTRLKSNRETTAGFRRLAGYIFGGNERSQSIAMTAPVQETLGPGSPVMAFTMPADYAMEDLPAPADASVALREVPGRTVATIRFSGWATAARIARKQKQLLAVLERHGVTTIGVPALNQYNPPWTAPFLRRNEIAVEVEWGGELAAL
jgi:hypothetical protein